MTLIENDSPKVQYTGPFTKGQLLPLTFPYIATEDVKMIIDDTPAIFNVDYEIITEPNDEHPVAYPNSAYIKSDLPNAKQITLYRVTPLDQQAPFPQQSKFRSERVEQALDKLTMQQQEQVEQLSRCIIAPITLETFNGQLPAPAADQALKWNTEGTELENYDIIGEQEAFETEVNTKFEEQSTAIENRIGQFEEETNTQFSDFRNEINENLEAVLNAADKLDTLEQQVQAATNAANTATNAANTALTSATRADEYAEEAFMSADQAEDALEEIKQVIQDAEDTIGELVTDALNNKVDLDGGNYPGSGLEAVVNKRGSGGLKIGQIGIAPFGIDETLNLERYLNGQIIIQDQFKGFTNYVKRRVALYPSIACLEDEWQTEVTMSAFSQCGKFVIDDNAGTIRLPKVVNIQGLTDLSKLGEIVEAGLPNITGTMNNNIASFRVYPVTTEGAFNGTNAPPAFLTKTGSGNAQVIGLNTLVFDASNSNDTYGNSDTVQQEQIQYPYFIQVATGSEIEDNIINEIELNNPYSFGDSKYSPVALNNLSWLKSEGQWNSKAVYPSFYDWALINANNSVEGFKFITDEYTDYDVVINTADETFRLPLLNGREDLIGYEKFHYDLPTVYRQTYIASCNGLVQVYSTTRTTEEFIRVTNENTGEMDESRPSLANVGSIVNVWVNKGDIFNIIGDRMEAIDDVTLFKAQGNGSLYYYVGETVQNANLINAGRIEEHLHSLIPDNSSIIAGYAMPSNRYINLTLGASGTTYTAPANGYFYFSKNSTAVGQYAIFDEASDGIKGELGDGVATTGYGVHILRPARKGVTVKLKYTLAGTTKFFRFVYAEGEV